MGGYLQYTNGIIQPSSILGPGGRYFTRKYPGLFVLAADVSGVTDLIISGNLGADGGGSVDGAVLEVPILPDVYRGFVKRVFNAYDPSVNHLVIVPSAAGASHEFSSYTDDDYHRVYNLTAQRIYYLLYAGANGSYIDNTAGLNIMNAFLDALRTGVQRLAVTPASGGVPAGGSVDLQVTFSSAGLVGGLYATDLVIDSNDPDEARVVVPTELRVFGIPDIVVTPTALEFGPVFIGQARTDSLRVSNRGTDLLDVTSLSTEAPAFSVQPTSFQLTPGQSRLVLVSFAPTAAGAVTGALTIASNDPDSPTLTVPLSGTGLEPPDIVVTPDSLNAELFTGEQATRTLNIANRGGSDLNFTIGTSLRALSVPVYEPLVLDKGAHDRRPGILGRGGPDVFGYRWRDSDEPGGPVFGWVDISGIGTPLPLTGDDMTFTGVAIGFGFPFYGSTFNTVNVCTNGFLSFTSPSSQYWNQPLPSMGAPENLLAIFWGDLYVPTPRIYTYRDATRFIVSYIAVQELGSGVPYTFQVILYRDGRIVYQYLESPGAWGAYETVGIQNATQDDGLTVAFNTAYAHNNLAVEIAATPPYLSVTPSMGTVPAGGSMDVTVGFDATGLSGGNYTDSLEVQSNDPDEARVMVPTRLRVTGAPDIAVTPTALDFGPLFIGQTRTDSLRVSNQGTDLLDVTGLSTEAPVFSVQPTSFQLAPGQSQLVLVSFAPTAAGAVTGALTIASNDPGSPTLTVPLSGTGLEPPNIVVTPDSLYVELGPDESAIRRLAMSNTGGSPLVWSASTSLSLSTSSPAAEAPPRPGGPAGTGDTRPSGADRVPPSGASGLGDLLALRLRALSGPFILFYDDMEHGLNGWTTLAYEPDDLWHQTERAFNSPTHSWWCGVEAQGNYDTGRRVRTAAASPLIDLRYAAPPVTLEFYEFFDTEPGYDLCGVEVASSGGGAGQPLRAPTSGSSGGWRLVALDLSPWVGWEILLRFSFDTVDAVANDYPGWFFDDVMVTSATPPWIAVEPSGGTIAAGGHASLNVTFSTFGLPSGPYSGAVIIASNDPDDNPVVVPARLVMLGASTVAVSAGTGQLELAPVKPNPARGATRLEFELSRPGPAHAAIFDVSGRKVRTLAEGSMAAGRYQFTWRGEDDRGAQRAGGVYMLRLDAEEGQRVRRFVWMP